MLIARHMSAARFVTQLPRRTPGDCRRTPLGLSRRNERVARQTIVNQFDGEAAQATALFRSSPSKIAPSSAVNYVKSHVLTPSLPE